MAATEKTSTKPTFTADERAALKEYSEELKKTAKRGGKATQEDGERDLLEKIEAMPEPDRSTATRVHEIIVAAAPGLTLKTWYGMPAYAVGNDTICFFQPASKFKARFPTLGFSDKAKLDDGDMWPIYYALNVLTPEVEQRIAELVRKASGQAQA
ncbi:iron chaperone [Rathayibacter sp. KR2-224]|uniref:iron chaperone n=1 Tax=Rathayibacter sp. KR2-224 TaxID=3400913 RepID=UPI003C042D1C